MRTRMGTGVSASGSGGASANRPGRESAVAAAARSIPCRGWGRAGKGLSPVMPLRGCRRLAEPRVRGISPPAGSSDASMAACSEFSLATDAVICV